MASNGIIHPAKTGKCRMCQRVRKPDTQLKRVGEVRHGMATGYVWECIDEEDCDRAMKNKLNNPKTPRSIQQRIARAIDDGRYRVYHRFC